MKFAKIAFVVCVILLIILAEASRFSILRRLGMGIPVSAYESQISQFLQSVSFAPVGLGIGVVALFFPQHIRHPLDKFFGKARAKYSSLELLGLRLAGLFFIAVTLVALWTTGQFLFQ